MGSTGTDILAPECSPIQLCLPKQSMCKHSLGPGYVLFWLKDCLMDPRMLLADVKVHEH